MTVETAEDPALAVDRYIRQSEHITDAMRQTGITVIGSGAVGSFTAVALAKMGFVNMKVFDFDTVEDHNLPNQFFRESDVGKPKVLALKQMIRAFGSSIEIENAKYEGQPVLPGIVISALDSIKARKETWEHLKTKTSIDLYIDARMSLEALNIHTVRPSMTDQVVKYETEFLDPVVVHERCTARTVMYTVLIAAGRIGSIVTRFLKGEEFRANFAEDLVNMETVQL